MRNNLVSGRLSLSVRVGSLVGGWEWSERKVDVRQSGKCVLCVCYMGQEWQVAKCWPNCDKTRQSVFPGRPLHPSTRPRGRAVCQRPSSLYLSPCLSHPFFTGILSSTHLSIRHIQEKHADTDSLAQIHTRLLLFFIWLHKKSNYMHKNYSRVKIELNLQIKNQ